MAPPPASVEPVLSANTQSAIVMVANVRDRQHAHRVARALVLRRHAAFVNILTRLKSVYRCQGEICREREYVLTIKTLDSEFEAVAATIRELHDDKLPEILAFDIKKGDRDLLDGVAQSLEKEAEIGDEVGVQDLGRSRPDLA